ncbi:hypothetical protein KIPB_014437, partial [Kipferlia bialata]
SPSLPVISEHCDTLRGHLMAFAQASEVQQHNMYDEALSFLSPLFCDKCFKTLPEHLPSSLTCPVCERVHYCCLEHMRNRQDEHLSVCHVLLSLSDETDTDTDRLGEDI